VDSKKRSTPIGYLRNGATIIEAMIVAPLKWTPDQVTQALMAVATTR